MEIYTEIRVRGTLTLMNKEDIIRAWRDRAFRESLSESDKRDLPPHPAGLPELPESAVREAFGGQFIPPPTPIMNDCGPTPSDPCTNTWTTDPNQYMGPCY